MKLLLTFIALVSGSLAQDYSQIVTWSLPDAVGTRFKNARIFEKYKLSERVNPFYLRGDFDGDGKPDYAVLVKAKADGKTRLAICLSIHAGVDVVGPGGLNLHVGTQKDGYEIPDFDWLDAWQVRPKLKLIPNDFNEPEDIRKMAGEALLVEKTESASALVYWDGSKFRWYQLSD